MVILGHTAQARYLRHVINPDVRREDRLRTSVGNTNDFTSEGEREGECTTSTVTVRGLLCFQRLRGLIGRRRLFRQSILFNLFAFSTTQKK